jgi:hypothetical protein
MASGSFLFLTFILKPDTSTFLDLHHVKSLDPGSHKFLSFKS